MQVRNLIELKRPESGAEDFTHLLSTVQEGTNDCWLLDGG
ncbi:hypothetical protein GQ55_1G092100 [Panicum hallii var. hallii]|uniref:Uncharacterized protein n=2 Tax=Panicum hallii TaxID=206008 RepID=A0A2T7F3W9_9POAL|nr:hypothetical protein PAHAL_1G094200 [Panicum hallii]PUZ74773.1 hypothetical protein GQ55_1G092100 [Panicum hallii var. hallii]